MRAPSTDITSYYRQRLSRVDGELPPVPALLGDIVNSEALYVKKALYNYADAGTRRSRPAATSRAPWCTSAPTTA